MAAQFGGPTQFDRAHRAALDTSEMAVMDLSIRLAMAAEDILHLQSRRHGRNRSARRHHLDFQPVKRASRAPDKAVQAKACCVGRRQGGACLQARHRLKKADNLVGAQ